MINAIRSIFNGGYENEWNPEGTERSIKPFKTDTLKGNYITFPHMIQIEIDELDVDDLKDGEEEFKFDGEGEPTKGPIYGASFRLFTDEDLHKSNVILLHTALCSRSIDEIGELSICYAIDLFSEHLLYPKLLVNRLDDKTYPVDISKLIVQIIASRGE